MPKWFLNLGAIAQERSSSNGVGKGVALVNYK